MADYNLGTARGQIEIGYSGNGPQKAQTDLAGLQKQGERTSRGYDQLASTMTRAGLVVAGGLALAVNSAVSFEKRLSGIKAVSGATTQEMEQIRSKALQLGKDTKYSASEAAEAMEELSKAGIKTQDIINGAADATVALAAAGEVSLPEAAEIAANAMNTFSLKAQDLPKVADLISGAANASAISVGEYRQSLQQAGAAAALAGFSIEDLSTAIALMGNAGIKGSDAGTSLKTFLQNLQPQTKKESELFKELGLITEDGSNKFYDAAGNVKSLADVSQILQDSLKGMTSQQKQAALNTLFGSDAIRAAAIISKAGAKGVDQLAASIGKVKAADVAKTRMDNLAGSIEQLKGSVETAGITIGSALIPQLRSVVDFVNKVISAFLELSPATQQTVVTVVKMVGAFLLIAGAGLKVISMLSALRIMLVTTFLANPVGLIIIGIVAALAALAIGAVQLYKRFEPFRNLVNTVFAYMKAAFISLQPVLATIVAGVQNFVRVLQGTANGGTGFVRFMGAVATVIRDDILPALKTLGITLVSTFGPILRQAITIVAGFVTSIIAYFRSIQPQLTAIFNFIRTIFNAVLPPLLVVVRFVFGQIFSVVISTLKLLGTGIMLVLNGIANIFRGVFNIIGGVVKIFLSLLTGNWSGAWDGIKQVVRGALQFILGIIQVILGGTIIAFCVTTFKAIGGIFKAGFALVRGIVNGAMAAIRGVIGGGMAAARGLVNVAIRIITGYFRGLSVLIGVVRSIFSRLVTTIGSTLLKGPQVVRAAIVRMISTVESFAGKMFSAGARILENFVNGVKSKVGAAVSVVKDAVGKIAGLFPGSPVKEGPLRAFNRGHAGAELMDMFSRGVSDATPGAVSAANVSAAEIRRQFEDLMRAQSFSASGSLGVTTTGAMASPAMAGYGGAGGSSAAATGALAGVDARTLADAVMMGLSAARFRVEGDGLARLVFDSATPDLVKGPRR